MVTLLEAMFQNAAKSKWQALAGVAQLVGVTPVNEKVTGVVLVMAARRENQSVFLSH